MLSLLSYSSLERFPDMEGCSVVDKDGKYDCSWMYLCRSCSHKASGLSDLLMLEVVEPVVEEEEEQLVH